jgi:arylsulfatase A-like enzyme
MVYFATELAFAALVVRWVGGAVGIFRVIAVDLGRLLPGYAILGAGCGLPVAMLASRAKRHLPKRCAGVGTEFFFLAAAFSLVAWLWNQESYLPRYSYALIAIVASGPASLLVMGAQKLAQRLDLGWRSTAGVWSAAGCGLAVVYLLSLWSGKPRLDEPGVVASSHPNVVLIVVDTLRRDRVSAFGYERETTPVIDALADEGALFENFTSTETWTLPAHASLFTGLYPREHQAHIDHTYLDGKYETLAEVLRAAGFLTAGYSANPWLSRVSGLDQGFQELRYLGVETSTGFLFLKAFEARLTESDLGARAVTDAALRFITDAESRRRPFFLFANYMEAHEPYGSFPEPFFSAFLREPLPRDIGQRWVRDTIRFQCLSCSSDPRVEAEGLTCRDDRWRVTPSRLEASVALYDAGVRYVDGQIGRIRDALRELAILDDTIFIVTSDHGESLGERGQMGHGAFLYQSVLAIPLVVRYPPLFPAGSRRAEPASLVDILPTLREALSLPPSSSISGRSLLSSESAARVGAFAEYIPYASERVSKATSRFLDCDFHAVGRGSVSLQVGSAKLIQYSDGTRELYDLDASPREETNLVGRRPEIESRLAKALDAIAESKATATTAVPAPELDEDTLRALKALGYVH